MSAHTTLVLRFLGLWVALYDENKDVKLLKK